VTQTKRSAVKRVVETCSRAPAAHASHAAETGSAKRHAPGGKLLRDDGSHLDFRLRCLKLCGVCGNGSGGSGGVHQPLRETLSSLAKPFQADPTKRETARLCAKIALDLFYLFRFWAAFWPQIDRYLRACERETSRSYESTSDFIGSFGFTLTSPAKL
jgi:hypothetical protein